MGVAFDPAAGNMRLQDAATMRRATVAGLGVGLLSIADAEEDLKLGRLVAPFGREIMTTMPEAKVPGFYLVFPKAHLRVAAIAAFCKWLQQQDWDFKPVPA
jgi:LysR family glycine cleavage system transcriptional activator